MRNKGICTFIVLLLIASISACRHQPIIPIVPADSGNNNNNNNNGNTTIKPDTGGTYIVFAWNDQGMHEMTQSYNKMVLLPPGNTLLAQVIRRGNPPQVVTSGIQVEYSVMNNTSSYNKQPYGVFWDNAVKLFGKYFGFTSLAHDIGFTGNGLSGTMKAQTDHFVADYIPVTPVDDNNKWNPYQIAEVTVKDNQGNVLIKTQAVLPVSDEINCARCHGTSPFDRVISQHDDETNSNLANAEPVLCASCHGSPILNMTGPGETGKYLSQSIHKFHAQLEGNKKAVCYDCHPGTQTQLSRSIRHTAADGNCIACHGSLSVLSSSIVSGRVPWKSEQTCTLSGCHDAAVSQVSTGDILYKDSRGHGNLYCAACHGTQHAMYPSSKAEDNYQAFQYLKNALLNKGAKTIGSCGVCHPDSRGKPVATFANSHGGNPPVNKNACHICHTQVSPDETKWPHAHQWKNSNL